MTTNRSEHKFPTNEGRKLHCELTETVPKYASSGREIEDDADIVNLSGLGLTNWPDAIKYLSNVSVLDLSDNSLTTVDPSLVSLTTLRTLYVSGNYIRTIPDFIADMTLDHIDFSQNPVVMVSPRIKEVDMIVGSDQYNGSSKIMPEWRPGFSASALLVSLFLWILTTPIYSVSGYLSQTVGLICAIIWFIAVPFISFKFLNKLNML